MAAVCLTGCRRFVYIGSKEAVNFSLLFAIPLQLQSEGNPTIGER